MTTVKINMHPRGLTVDNRKRTHKPIIKNYHWKDTSGAKKTVRFFLIEWSKKRWKSCTWSFLINFLILRDYIKLHKLLPTLCFMLVQTSGLLLRLMLEFSNSFLIFEKDVVRDLNCPTKDFGGVTFLQLPCYAPTYIAASNQNVFHKWFVSHLLMIDAKGGRQ